MNMLERLLETTDIDATDVRSTGGAPDFSASKDSVETLG